MFASLRGYDRAWLRGDLVAGLTVWAVEKGDGDFFEKLWDRSPSWMTRTR